MSFGKQQGMGGLGGVKVRHRGEYDQNIPYEILKEYKQVFESRSLISILLVKRCMPRSTGRNWDFLPYPTWQGT